MKALLYILMSWYMVACQPTAQPKTDSAPPIVEPPTSPLPQQPEPPIVNNPNDATANQFELTADLNPLDASLSMSQPSLEKIAAIEDVLAPSFSIKLDGANFYQIMRCSSEYKLRNYREQNLLERKQAWQEALNNSYSCQLIAREGAQAIFQDLAFATGIFYYIVNPCVSETRSTTGQQDCSYQLAISPKIETKSPFQDLERQLFLKIQDIQAQVTARYSRAEVITDRLAQVQTKCNYEWVDRQIYLTHLKGMLSALVTLGLGAKFGFDNFMMLFMPSIAIQAASPFLFGAEAGQGSYRGPECVEAAHYKKAFSTIMDRSWFQKSQHEMSETLSKIISLHEGLAQLDEEILEKQAEGLKNYILRDQVGSELDDFITEIGRGQALKLPTVEE